MNLVYDVYQSKIGNLYILSEDGFIVSVDIGDEKFNKLKNEYIEKGIDIKKSTEDLKEAISQIDDYFNGKRKVFDLNIRIEGTEFQKSVYREMLKIPYGKTLYYSDIAKNINNPKSVRAIGQASKCNKIPIIIPCHRVVGKNNIGGYMGNHSDLKEILLNLEKQS
ncbi:MULTISPECIES: methylated-DNA--[protein]-cysteine S-methyltransferase [unclassified Clostridioides]|uniref:methylated-DNA--[protein]-cysteine S-methyltransferase n=1 Tax=unclassified Clostridioides TaxID=2635829 RepID=UPI001D128248|nr:methylated-DNA--[protein]-cysteine S-methyltransferase [Clostridioides sp. ES-S-0171-01]MCC0687345.1 methylated-DNA--[protein]-cysteine S-methyltransferase [Clostridioides sp. ES-S-0056-01]UDN56221.1 methylated-DNA--[protein]-cysteine S-methyltransferase [Clostridioides sp. ES-S-0054-01]